MLIGGWQKFSLIDYPDKLAAVIFTRGCPFRCQFCHNQSLVIPSAYGPLIDEEKILAFLKKRQGKLDAVVITGGEPTWQKDLPEFLEKIRKLDFLIKLDTCGTNPAMLKKIIQQNLIDYIAMDLKSPLKNYAKITGVKVDTKKILKSIFLILDSKIKKEFRSTLVKGLHTIKDVEKMADLIPNAPLYSLQKYINENPLNSELKDFKTFSDNEFLDLKKKLENKILSCQIR